LQKKQIPEKAFSPIEKQYHTIFYRRDIYIFIAVIGNQGELPICWSKAQVLKRSKFPYSPLRINAGPLFRFLTISQIAYD